MMFDIGRICIKIAGRDAGKTCVVVDVLDERTVLIDGQTRRRNCNVLHLDPTSRTLPIKKNASQEEVISAFKKENLVITPKKSKKPVERPKKIRKQKEGKKKDVSS